MRNTNAANAKVQQYATGSLNAYDSNRKLDKPLLQLRQDRRYVRLVVLYVRIIEKEIVLYGCNSQATSSSGSTVVQ